MRYVWVVMKLLTKNDWQRSRTVALFQSHGIMLPTNGMRWILWVILPTGMMLASWALPWCAHETLNRRLFASGLGWKGVNHSTYAKWSGGWLLTGTKSFLAIGLMVNTAHTCTTRWADVGTIVSKNRRLHSFGELTSNTCITLLSTVNKHCIKPAMNGFQWWFVLPIDAPWCRLNMYYVSYWFAVPIVTGSQKLDLVICRDRDEREVDSLYFLIKMSLSDSQLLPLDHKSHKCFTELWGTIINFQIFDRDWASSGPLCHFDTTAWC